jgi:hypothetical protein
VRYRTRVPRSHRFAALTAVGLTLWLTVSGCVSTTAPTDAATAATTGPVVTTTPANGASAGSAESQNAPGSAPEAMPVKLVGGGLLDLAAYTDKPLLLWFWAPF